VESNCDPDVTNTVRQNSREDESHAGVKVKSNNVDYPNSEQEVSPVRDSNASGKEYNDGIQKQSVEEHNQKRPTGFVSDQPLTMSTVYHHLVQRRQWTTLKKKQRVRQK
jgi:hypothetical protein